MKTPLYNLHKSLGAKFTEFAGWEMPVEYSSISKEVLSVREDCGIFDISHMGRLLIKDSLEKLEYITSRSIAKLKPKRVQYNLLMNRRGGIRDDITIYRLSEDEFFLCVNAVNKEKVCEWFKEEGIKVEDISHKTVQFALQGPRAVEVLKEFFPVESIRYYHFEVFDGIIVSRTGYTGEDGFEVYAEASKGIELFEKLVKVCTPCGLGARDVLRIEAGMPLYGHEISEDITPFEANLDRYVSLEKDFFGQRGAFKKGNKEKAFWFGATTEGCAKGGL